MRGKDSLAVSISGTPDRGGVCLSRLDKLWINGFALWPRIFSLLLVLAFIDLDHKVLPNVLTLPGLVSGLIFSLLGWTIPVVHSLVGAVLGFGVITLIVLVSKGGMGMGDAKLMALIGSFLGWIPVFYVIFWASALGAVVTIIYLYLTKQDRKTPVPFGPFLAVAALAYFFFV